MNKGAKFEKCPVCGKKGWYISSSQYDLDHRLHSCRYCQAHETVLPCQWCDKAPVIVSGALTICRHCDRQSGAAYLLGCGGCHLDLGRLSGAVGDEGRTECPRCGWWITWRVIVDEGQEQIEFMTWDVKREGEKP